MAVKKTKKEFFKTHPKFMGSFPDPFCITVKQRGVEVAFLGRSNVGKSSLINALAGFEGLAKTSNTPGRTQLMNFFEYYDEGKFLVDLPGYGFAKAPKQMVEKWQQNTKDYLLGRAELQRVFLLIDSRMGIKSVDEKVMEMFDVSGVVYQIILTKIDKVSEHELERKIESVKEIYKDHPALHHNVLCVSSKKREGLDSVKSEIYNLFYSILGD